MLTFNNKMKIHLIKILECSLGYTYLKQKKNKIFKRKEMKNTCHDNTNQKKYIIFVLISETTLVQKAFLERNRNMS